MLTGSGGFYRSVKRQQIGLKSDVINDFDLIRDIAHSYQRLRDRRAAFVGFIHCLIGDVLGFPRVIRILSYRRA